MGEPFPVLSVAKWWDILLGRSKPEPDPLLDNVESLEDLVREVTRIRQILQRDMAELRNEWGDTLDKLTRRAAQFSARQRKRAQRELDEDDEEETPPPPPRPPTETHAAPNGGPVDIRRLTKAQLRQYLNSRMG